MENLNNMEALHDEDLEKVDGGNIVTVVKDIIAEHGADAVKTGVDVVKDFGSFVIKDMFPTVGEEKAYGFDPDAPAFAPAKEDK